MKAIVDGLGALGAGLLHGMMAMAWAVGSAWVGYQVGERKNQWWGWGAGLATAVLLIFLLGPSMEALERAACANADDFNACVEGD